MHQDQVIEVADGFDVIAGSCYCWNYLTAYKTQVLTVQGHPEFTMPFFTAFLKNIKEKFDEELINKAQFSLQGNINNKKFNQLLNQYLWKYRPYILKFLLFFTLKLGRIIN